MARRFLPLLAALALGAALAPAWAQTPYVGEIKTFAFDFCPVGWAPLDGAPQAIAENTTLFTLLGTTYGGDGAITFALPNAPQKTTLGQGAPFLRCISLFGIFPSRN